MPETLPGSCQRRRCLLFALYVGGAAMVSLQIGWLFDSLALLPAIVAVNAMFTAILFLVWFLARRVR